MKRKRILRNPKRVKGSTTKGKDYGKSNKNAYASNETVIRNIERRLDSYEETSRMRASPRNSDNGNAFRKRSSAKGNDGDAIRQNRIGN